MLEVSVVPGDLPAKQNVFQRASDVTFRSYDAGHEITKAMREDIREWLQAKNAS